MTMVMILCVGNSGEIELLVPRWLVMSQIIQCFKVLGENVVSTSHWWCCLTRW